MTFKTQPTSNRPPPQQPYMTDALEEVEAEETERKLLNP